MGRGASWMAGPLATSRVVPCTVSGTERRTMNSVVSRVIDVVSDGTGRSHDEVVVVATVGAAAVGIAAAWRGIAWAVQTVTDQDPWPAPPSRNRE
jgi:hypothetical protein